MVDIQNNLTIFNTNITAGLNIK